METIKFKTNIKCAGCVEKVTPFLNADLGEGTWQVDYSDPSKILTVPAGKATKVVSSLEKAGYRAEKL